MVGEPGAFDATVDDPTVGMVHDLAGGHDTVLVAFGGLGLRMGIPPFEFFRIVADLPVAKVFLRDLDGFWYRGGVRGLGADAAESITGLGELLDGAGLRRRVFVGVSAGGFGALWYGSLLGADVIHAFVPQTTIRRGDRLRLLDRRFAPDIRGMRTALRNDVGTQDVRPIVRERPGSAVHLHVGGEHRLDQAHARRLRGLAHVQTHTYPGLAHNDLTRSLRDAGTLRALLLDAISAPDSPTA